MEKKFKKHWNKVSIQKINGNDTIFLDDKILKSPLGREIILPHNLTKAVYKEWSIIDDIIIPSKMPNYSLAVTAIDRVSTQKDYVLSQLLSFVKSDLLCYWSGEDKTLKRKQEIEWKPILEWFEKENNIKFKISLSIMPVKQSEVEEKKIKKHLSSLDDFTLSGLFNLVSSSGSFVLCWSVYKKNITLKRFYDLALLEELYQVEKWGSDDEAIQRRKQIYKNFLEVHNFLKLINS